MNPDDLARQLHRLAVNVRTSPPPPHRLTQVELAVARVAQLIDNDAEHGR